MGSERTIPDVQQRMDATAARPRDVLYVAFVGERPTAEGLAVDLSVPEAPDLVLGRGAVLATEPGAAPGERRLRLPDGRVSERHAIVSRRADGLYVEDLGSTNGTFVDGVPVTRPIRLTGACTVSAGRSVLLYVPQVADAQIGAPARVPGAPRLDTFAPPLSRAHRLLAQVAPSAVPVVLQGETGTGKEVAARALHDLSGRSGRFVAVNCGALPEGLVESELFGVRKGAFSGATQDKAGWLRAAHGGTLLLDEAGELSLAAQVKLLRALQEKVVLPLGAAAPEPADFRLVCASNRDLAQMVEAGAFRSDLWGRVRGVEVRLPPLRERRADVGALVARLLDALAGARGAELRFERRVAEALVRHDWPLNVRELERVVEALLSLAGPDRLVTWEALQETTFARPPAARRPPESPDETRAQLVAELSRHGGNISAVARSLSRTRMQIHRWLRRFSIDPDSYRPK